MKLEILGVAWCNEMSRRPIGIVLVLDLITKEVLCFIGTGDGEDELVDVRSITERGARLTLETLIGLTALWEGAIESHRSETP